ncbi:hypothetical protein [Rhizobium sp. GN54]|uniref:hypothetical protein n=1 Tax=Rhizobium sp. GN54 TaxID=2898150 RepID=UPI001E4A7704|nr:hypothetical protein [Rhizobium sp. GN54]MCD2184479.1 hypothetical protein [Rhizobium sp. GN54]
MSRSIPFPSPILEHRSTAPDIALTNDQVPALMDPADGPQAFQIFKLIKEQRMSFPDAETSKANRPLNINRRDPLLGGTVLVAASAAIASGAPGTARAQEQPAGGGTDQRLAS